MTTPVRVVARFVNGTVMKGTTQDFSPNRPGFHLFPADGGRPVDTRFAELKAVFFVKDFAGDPQRPKLRGFLAAVPTAAQGKKVAVHFRDGELLCGYALSYTPDRDGFFLSPVDADGNNIRIYVVTASTASVQIGPAAEVLARRVLGG